MGGAVLAAGVIAASVGVTIENVANSEGSVLVALCTEDEYAARRCGASSSEPARRGSFYVVFDGTRPGRYGVFAFHDRNENGRLDLHWYGPPREGYGASNNPPPRIGPARWRDIAFEVADDDVEVSITLRGGPR